jgi:hypothetical protein
MLPLLSFVNKIRRVLGLEAGELGSDSIYHLIAMCLG